MSVFLVWMGLVVIIFLTYIVFLWKRRKHRSRFQARLTILFLLFVIIPTIPLIFFMANLLTESADLLLVPGIGDALETSLSVIRLQSEERACLFFKQYPDHLRWSPGLMQSYNIIFLGCYRVRGDSLRILRDLRLADCPVPQGWSPDLQHLASALGEKRTSWLIPMESNEVMMLCQTGPDSIVHAAASFMDPRISAAKDNIQRAYTTYSSLTLIKESIIQKNLIWAIAVLWVAGLSVLAVFLSRELSRGISEPILALVEGMNLVAEGDLSARVETKAKDEILFLVDSYNRMIEDLDTSRKKLIKAERMAAWQDVARRISHEIKNSLTPISASLHRFRTYFKDENMPQKIAESLLAVEEEIASLKNMATEFSEFSRMPEPRKKTMNMNEIIQGMILLFQPMARGIKFRTQLVPDLPAIEADREQMKRVINNLIRNALDASPEGTTITLISRPARKPGYSVEIEVADQGRGMNSETLEKAFLPHFTTKSKGSGLGLSIVQKIVEDHDGDISIFSQEGQGTRVVILL